MKITRQNIHRAWEVVAASRKLPTEIERIEFNYHDGMGPFAHVYHCTMYAGKDLPFGNQSLVLKPSYRTKAALVADIQGKL